MTHEQIGKKLDAGRATLGHEWHRAIVPRVRLQIGKKLDALESARAEIENAIADLDDAYGEHRPATRYAKTAAADAAIRRARNHLTRQSTSP